MRLKQSLPLGIAMLMMFAAAPASASACCDTQAMSCCQHASQASKSCCKHESMTAMDKISAVQRAVVWFERPVWVGTTVLMGKHVIEHDTDRQSRGEPCTHIYAADDLKTPVAAFHCTHLDRTRVEQDTVVLRPLPDGHRRFVEFQFAGEAAGHGYPTGR
jgi:hypothetical protein